MLQRERSQTQCLHVQAGAFGMGRPIMNSLALLGKTKNAFLLHCLQQHPLVGRSLNVVGRSCPRLSGACSSAWVGKTTLRRCRMRRSTAQLLQFPRRSH